MRYHGASIKMRTEDLRSCRIEHGNSLGLAQHQTISCLHDYDGCDCFVLPTISFLHRYLVFRSAPDSERLSSFMTREFFVTISRYRRMCLAVDSESSRYGEANGWRTRQNKPRTMDLS